MAQYVARRLLWALPQIAVVLLLAFVIVRLLPGEPARAIVGAGGVTQDFIDMVRERYHLDEPVWRQFITYVSGLAQGDLGISLTARRPVLDVVLGVYPSTLLLAAIAFAVGWPLGVFFGGLAARRPNGLLDAGITSVATALISVPSYFLALLLLYVFAFQAKLVTLSAGGMGSLILPTASLALIVIGLIARVSRSSLTEARTAPHVTVARAKGLSAHSIWSRHVRRNGLIPVTTVGGLIFGELLGGAVFVEVIFIRPGLGRLAVDALTERDFALIQGIILLVALTYVVINVVVDLVYAFLDPEFRDHLQAVRA